MRSDGEDLATVARNENIFIVDMPEQRLAFAKRGE